MQACESLPARRPLDVLLVEDDDIDARIIGLVSDLIEELELRVTRVSSLVDARSAIDRTKFDVCLLDFWLGSESSLRFLSALEAMDGQIGTVVLSNISPKEAASFRLATHRNYFLPKVKCTPQQLQSAIEAVAPPLH
jgi:DNA-binding NtrC family response regulator